MDIPLSGKEKQPWIDQKGTEGENAGSIVGIVALAALREKRTELARTQLAELVAEFPENRLFASELAKLNAPPVILDLPIRGRTYSRSWSKVGGRRMSTCAGKLLD